MSFDRLGGLLSGIRPAGSEKASGATLTPPHAFASSLGFASAEPPPGGFLVIFVILILLGRKIYKRFKTRAEEFEALDARLTALEGRKANTDD